MFVIGHPLQASPLQLYMFIAKQNLVVLMFGPSWYRETSCIMVFGIASLILFISLLN